MTVVGSGSAMRVAAPGALFWVIKVLTTGAGETTSDALVRAAPPEVVVPLALAALVVALAVQLRARTYHPVRYWTTALLVSVFGTMAADVLHVGLGVPYAASTAGFAALLAAVFGLWWLVERDLSVHDVTTLRRECFYWAAVLATFALGTALGDLTAAGLGLGYLASAALFLVLFALPGAAFGVLRTGAVPTFWAAYVLTRPLGASVADWTAVPPARGGLDLGAGPVSAAALVLIAVLVGVATLSVRRAAPAA